MKSKIRNSQTCFLAIFTLGLIAIQSCTKEPVPDFSYEPSDNPEAGDSIHFTNSSLEATSFEWDFGNGVNSTDENPSIIYETSGTYDVILNAINDRSTVPITKEIIINNPTGMGIFALLDDTVTIVPGVLVSVYNNKSDWENYLALMEDYTDDEGFVLFQNLESQAYIVDLYHETDTGVWFAAGTTGEMTKNQIDLYVIPMVFYPPDMKKSLLKVSADRKLVEASEFKQK